MSYLEYERLDNGQLKLILTPEGREEIESHWDAEDESWDISPDDIFHELLAETWCGMTCNGWDYSDNVCCWGSWIISEDGEWPDEDSEWHVPKGGKYYYFNDYALRLEIEDLLENGCLILDYGVQDE